MKIFDETKTYEIAPEQVDYEKGYLKLDKKFVVHHEAVEAKEAVYDTVTEQLENGSSQTFHPLITPAIKAQDAYDEYEDIQVYVPYTEMKLKEIAFNARIDELRRILQELDYDINACEDGVIKAKTLEEYRAERVAVRNELRALQGKVPLEKGVIDYAKDNS